MLSAVLFSWLQTFSVIRRSMSFLGVCLAISLKMCRIKIMSLCLNHGAILPSGRREGTDIIQNWGPKPWIKTKRQLKRSTGKGNSCQLSTHEAMCTVFQKDKMWLTWLDHKQMQEVKKNVMVMVQCVHSIDHPKNKTGHWV